MILLTGAEVVANARMENVWLDIILQIQMRMFPADEVAEDIEAVLLYSDIQVTEWN